MHKTFFYVRRAGLVDAQDLGHPIRSCGLFEPDELDGFLDQMPDLLNDPSQLWLRLDHGEGIAGAAYFARDGLSSDVWNLLFIGLDPAHQAQGGGQLLLKQVEANVSGAGGRMLLVETSSAEIQAPARRFYHAAGYSQQAVITDYYADGIDKVIFTKRF